MSGTEALKHLQNFQQNYVYNLSTMSKKVVMQHRFVEIKVSWAQYIHMYIKKIDTEKMGYKDA